VRYAHAVSDGIEARGRGDRENAFTPGTVIDGKFRIERIIGVGGMGTVLAAHHIGLDKPVALKVLVDDVGDRSAIQRLIREARAVAQLESAGVARVLDVGSTSSGAPYIVMERLVGLDFGALLRVRGTLPVDEAARYIVEACAPLEEAHGVGIVHRDLKPQNLFLAETKPGRKVVKVLDFGISRFDPKADREEPLTAQHQMLGTPRYMPPEQIGGARNADARSDVYSLGACLYHFVAGKSPVGGGPLTTVLAAIRTDVPARLDTLRSDVPRAFADVVARCLEKSPAARFPSIQAMREALAPFATEPATTRRARGDGHLGDDTIVAMQERALAPEALRRAQAHLVACGECRELVAFAAASTRDDPNATLDATATVGGTAAEAAPTVTLQLADTVGDPPAVAMAHAAVAGGPTLASAEPAAANAAPTLTSAQAQPHLQPSPRAAASSSATFQPAMVSVAQPDFAAQRGGAGRGVWIGVGGAVVVATLLASVAAVRHQRAATRSPDPTSATSATSATSPTSDEATGAGSAPATTASGASAGVDIAAPTPSVAQATASASARASARGAARRNGAASPARSASPNPIGAGIPDER
jgi:hypothetical protein